MSIIQEALKKIHERPPKKRPQIEAEAQDQSMFVSKYTSGRRARKNNSRLYISLGVISIALFSVIITAVFVLRKKDPGPSFAASYQEVSYRSLSDVKKKIDSGAAQPQSSHPNYPELILNGIMYLENGPRAIINNSIVSVGSIISGASVTEITKRSVLLKFEDSEITLNLK